jgi:hypothetical protein
MTTQINWPELLAFIRDRARVFSGEPDILVIGVAAYDSLATWVQNNLQFDDFPNTIAEHGNAPLRIVLDPMLNPNQAYASHSARKVREALLNGYTIEPITVLQPPQSAITSNGATTQAPPPPASTTDNMPTAAALDQANDPTSSAAPSELVPPTSPTQQVPFVRKRRGRRRLGFVPPAEQTTEVMA